MPAWTDYTSKTTPADTDEVMIKDFSDSNKANKRMLFSGLWNWIVNKLTNAVIANLETSPQTIVGAINSLNSNLSRGRLTFSWDSPVEGDSYLSMRIDGTEVARIQQGFIAGELSSLTTKSKDSLVSAVNEVNTIILDILDRI